MNANFSFLAQLHGSCKTSSALRVQRSVFETQNLSRSIGNAERGTSFNAERVSVL